MKKIDMQPLWNRLGLITTLAEKMPGMGRTALMKMVYLLQTLRKVPLGYNFTLYSYGPFDTDVLNELAYAKVLEAVKEKIVYYPNGYGYEIHAGDKATEMKSTATKFLQDYQEHIEWVVQEFGQHGAADLELISTMVYADQEAQRNKELYESGKFARLVREIKPQFNQNLIQQMMLELIEKGLLKSVTV